MNDTPRFSQSLRAWLEAFTHRSMRDWARFVKASGFSMPQLFLLMHVHGHAQCGMSDLSAHLDITPAAASQLADKLVQAGLLVRAEDPHDRRARQMALTEAGRELLERGLRERYRWVETLTGMLTTEEKEKITVALEIMTQAVRKMKIEI